MTSDQLRYIESLKMEVAASELDLKRTLKKRRAGLAKLVQLRAETNTLQLRLEQLNERYNLQNQIDQLHREVIQKRLRRKAVQSEQQLFEGLREQRQTND